MKKNECKKYIDFNEEAKQLENILIKYKNTRVQFVDPNFHPKLKIKELSKFEFNTKAISWKRIDELYNAPLFQKDLINPNFIFQGSLADCYFISAITRVASEPYLVKSFFNIETPEKILGPVQDSINIKCGAVVVYFYCFGRRTPVLIDTLVPTIRDGKLKFSRPLDTTKSPWFCLVEKAYAKLNGSYSNIESGFSSEAIYSFFLYDPIIKEIGDLTSHEKISKMTVFDRLMKYQKQGAVMSASIHLYNNFNNVTKKEINQKNLVLNHSYSLLKARKCGNKCFILLKNPWGKKEWNGPWSKNSPLWTSKLKEELEYNEIQNGTFWMNSKDFFRYFTFFMISKPIHPEWFCRRFCVQLTPGKHDGYELTNKRSRIEMKPNFVFQVTTPIPDGKKCRFHIIVERRSRQFKNKKKNSQYPEYCIFFGNAKGKKLNSKNIFNCKSEMFFSSDLISSFTYDVYSNDTITTIILNRLNKSNFTEDFYVLLYSKFDFKLYNLDYPEYLMNEVENRGVVFENYSKKNPEISLPLVPSFVKGKNVITFADSIDDALSSSREEEIERIRYEIDAEQSEASLDALYPFNDTFNLTYNNKVKYCKETSKINIKSNKSIFDIEKESEKIDILNKKSDTENDDKIIITENRIDDDEIQPITKRKIRKNLSVVIKNKRKQPPISINKPRHKIEFITSDSDEESSSSSNSREIDKKEIPIIIVKKKKEIEPIKKEKETSFIIENKMVANKEKEEFIMSKSREVNAVNNEDKYIANLLSKMMYEKEKEIKKIGNQKNDGKNIYCLNMQLEKEKLQFQLLKEKVECDEFDLELENLSKFYLNE